MVGSIEQKKCGYCSRVFSSAEDFYQNTCRWRVCDKKNLWFNCSCGSTLMLPSGKFAWYAPTKNMSSTAASVFNSISALQSLPHVPAAVMEMQQLLQSSEVEVSTLARKVKSNPFIAANLMSLANSIKSNRDPHDRHKIESLEHAIMFVGKKTLSDLVMTISIKMFRSDCKVFSVDDFWREAFLTGAIAESLVNQFGYSYSKDEVYISAALCNIGKFVAAACLPHAIDKVQSCVDNPKTLSSWRSAEIALGVADHCILGEIGATLWGLPAYVVDAAMYHHGGRLRKPSATDETGLGMMDVIALANQLSHWILLRPSRIDMLLLDRLCVLAHLTKKDLDDLAALLTPLARQTPVLISAA